MIETKNFDIKAVLIGQKPYMSKKGQQKYQYKFTAFGMVFNLLGEVDLSASLSDLSAEAVRSGTLSVEFASFNDQLYLQFRSFVV
jgi:uracil DNA glycosylase